MDTADEILHTANTCEKALNIMSNCRTPNEIRNAYKTLLILFEELNEPAFQELTNYLKKSASYTHMLYDSEVNNFRNEIIVTFTRDVKNYREVAKQLGGGSKSSSEGANSSDKGCYIATACYGDYNTPQVVAFKRYRDKFLLKSRFGQIIIKIYYKFSPYLANRLKNNLILNRIIRKALLDPIYKYYIIRKNRN